MPLPFLARPQIEQQKRLAQYAAAAGHTAAASAASGVVLHGGADVDAVLDAGSEPAMHAFLSHMREADALARQMVLDGRGAWAWLVLLRCRFGC